jgi:hypothetical protein
MDLPPRAPRPPTSRGKRQERLYSRKDAKARRVHKTSKRQEKSRTAKARRAQRNSHRIARKHTEKKQRSEGQLLKKEKDNRGLDKRRKRL